MEQSTLVPFIRENLNVLFVGLNPAKSSSRNRHYFSVNQALWNQLYDAGLIISNVDKNNADTIIFGGTDNNFQSWSYGIVDLVTSVAESNSRKVKPTDQDCEKLRVRIYKFAPKTAILLHGKVLNKFLPFLGYSIPTSNSGQLGKLIPGCPTMFFNIAFPHGNTIKSVDKVTQYKAVKQYLSELPEQQRLTG